MFVRFANFAFAETREMFGLVYASSTGVPCIQLVSASSSLTQAHLSIFIGKRKWLVSILKHA